VETIAKLTAKLASGEITSTALVENSLERIEDPAGEGERIFISLHKDKARRQALEVDGQRKSGNTSPPLAGIPFSAKDLFDIAGQVTTAGSKVLADAPAASHTATVIQRLEDVGMINIGRANMTEFAYSCLGLNPHYGTPKSVYDRATGRCPGGSSCGSAVSIADHLVSATVGTDTGGSCRTPAAFNNIVGFKPSCGRMPSEGVYPLSVNLDAPGPFGNSVACCHILDQVMAGEDVGSGLPELVPAQAKSITLTVPQSIVLEHLDPEVASAFANSLTKLSQAGVNIIDTPAPFFDRIIERNAIAGIAQYDAYQLHKDLLATRGDEYDEFVRWRITSSRNITEEMVQTSWRLRRELIAEATAMISNPLHAFAFPTVAIIPPRIADVQDMEAFKATNFRALRNTSTFNFLDGCSISLPSTAPGEAPVGFMLSMMHGRDPDLFSISAGVETILQTQMK
jgi:aspartyl-tRNA(Asn)/glutamyl-tRNA(Gln) amidotransferase subunit A